MRVSREKVPEISVLEKRELKGFVIKSEGKGASHGTREKEGREREERELRVALFTRPD